MDKGGARPAQGSRAARAGGPRRRVPLARCVATVPAEHASTTRAGRGWAQRYGQRQLETKTNRDTDEEWLYQYDVLGNLLSVGPPDGRLIEYLVDGLGRRVGKKIDGVLLQQWVYRDGLKPVAELDGAGNLVAEFVYGVKNNVPDYVRRGGVTYRVTSDHLGSPMHVVNAGNPADVPFSASYAAFGEVAGTGLGWMPLGFAGGMYDADSGLVRFGARDLDPVAGRWTSKDPILFDGDGPNLFGYVLADPINLTDASGEGPVDCGRAIKRYLECKESGNRSLDNRKKENSCRPDKGHDKAIEQKNNRCEELRRKAFNACKDPSTWGPLLLGAVVGVGVGVVTGGAGWGAAAGAAAAL